MLLKTYARPIFLSQTINSSIRRQKSQKIVKKYGKVTPCNLLKVEYISRGATVFSRVSFHWSDNNYGQDTDKSCVALWSFNINETLKKDLISQKFFLTEQFKGQENCLDLSGRPCRLFWFSCIDTYFKFNVGILFQLLRTQSLYKVKTTNRNARKKSSWQNRGLRNFWWPIARLLELTTVPFTYLHLKGEKISYSYLVYSLMYFDTICLSASGYSSDIRHVKDI